jgi:hypothetical protein
MSQPAYSIYTTRTIITAHFIYEEIRECNVNKSGKRLYIYEPKVSSTTFIATLAGEKIKNKQYTLSVYFFLANCLMIQRI